MVKRLLWLACVAAFVGCSSGQPAPVFGVHPEPEFVAVDYPPPAAVVEIVSEHPRDDAVWVDGHWIWRGRYWVGKRGGWVLPGEGVSYCRPEIRYTRRGGLLYAEGVWHDAHGAVIDAPPFLLPAAVPPTDETAEQSVVP